MKIKVLIIEPKKEPRIAEIENTLESLQTVVGGLVEYVNLEEDIDLICNEEGKINHLEYNRAIIHDIICGTFIIAGHNNGDTISLSEEKLKYYADYFKLENDEGLIEFLRRYEPDSSNLVEQNLNIINTEKDRRFIIKGIDKDKFNILMNELEKLLNKYDTKEFITATYILIRYGLIVYENYIDSIDVECILKEIKKCDTIFDEELNYKIDKILNSDKE